jgi:hypothetical protein
MPTMGRSRRRWRAARSGLGNGTLLARPAGPDGGAGGLFQRAAAQPVQAIQPAGPQPHDEVARNAFGRHQVRIGDGRQHHLGAAQGQRGGDVQREVGAHGAAERQQPVEAALFMPLARQSRSAPGHQRHGLVLVAAGGQRLQRHASRRGHLAVGDVGHHRAMAEHADIHHQRLAAEPAHGVGQVADLVALGVDGADEQDAGGVGL